MNTIIHKKSKVKETNGQAKLPTSSQLVPGEIAINYAKDVETISFINDNNEVVTVRTEEYNSAERQKIDDKVEALSNSLSGYSKTSHNHGKLTLSGDVTGEATITSGTGAMTLSTTVGNDSHSHTVSTISGGTSGQVMTSQGSSAATWTSQADMTVGRATIADGAAKLATAREIKLTGAVTGTTSFDGSSGVTINTTVNHNHTFASLTSKPTTLSGYGITDAATASDVAAINTSLSDLETIRSNASSAYGWGNHANAGYYKEKSATTAQTGTVKLNNTVTSTATTEAATANAVKTAYDKGVEAYNLASGKTSNNGTVTSVKVEGASGLTGSGTVTSSGTITIKHVTASTATTTSAATLTHGGTFKAPSISRDGYGHITAVTETTYTLPSDNNTHYTSKNVVGASSSATANAAVTSNGSVWLNHIEEGTVTSSHNIVGSGGTTVKSDANGKITINSTAPDHSKTSPTAGTAGATGATSGATISIPYVTVNGSGHVTTYGTRNHKISASDLGLGQALKYCGITTTELTDGSTAQTVTINGASHTAEAGCVVFYGDKEFVYNGSVWELLGGDSTYKVVQTAVSSPSTSGNATAFIDTISQDANGVITVTKKNVNFPAETYTKHEDTSNLSGSYGTTATSTSHAVKQITVDDKGHVTGIVTGTTPDTKYTHPTTSGNKHIPSGGTSGQFLGWSADGTAAWVGNPNTDTKVTSVSNHYAPATDTAKTITKNASSTTSATWGSSDFITGITVSRDAAGHITDLSVSSLQMPANPNTDTATTLDGHYTPTANTASTLTKAASGGSASWNTSVVSGINLQRDAKGHVVGITVDSVKIPSNPNTDTATTQSGHYAPKTTATTVAGSSGQLSHSGTLTIPSLTFDDKGHLVSGTTTTCTLPSDNNTHYTAKPIAASASTSTSNNTASSNPYLNIVENGAVSGYVQIKGSGATTVSASGGVITISSTDNDTKYTHPTTSGNKHIPSGGSSGQFLGWSADGTAAWVANPNTDTKVTSVTNHYAPVTDTGKTISKTASSTTNATWGSSDFITGITVSRDAAGHITDLSVSSLQLPANPNTDTATTQSGHYAPKTTATTIAGGSGQLSHSGTFTVPSLTFDSKGHLVSGTTTTYTLPSDNDTHHTAYLRTASATTSTANTKDTANGVYFNLVENGTVRSNTTLSGTSNVTVTSPTAGTVVITGPGTGTTSAYGLVKISNGDVSTVASANGLAAGMDHTHGDYETNINTATSRINDLQTSLNTLVGEIEDNELVTAQALTYLEGKIDEITTEIEDNEYVTAQSLTDLDARVSNLLSDITGSNGLNVTRDTDTGAVNIALVLGNSNKASIAVKAREVPTANTYFYPVQLDTNGVLGVYPSAIGQVTGTVTSSTKFYPLGHSSSASTTATAYKSTSVYVSGGTKVCASGGFYQTSDERKKDFLNDIEIDFEKLRNIPKSYFTWKDGDDKTLQIGTSAQEVQKIYPELVGVDNETGELSLDYALLSIIALKAVDILYEEKQEMKERLDRIEKALGL